MGRIKAAPKPRVGDGRIRVSSADAERPIVFSFRFLDCSNPKFRVDAADPGYVRALLERLRDLGTWTFTRLRTEGARSLRFHAINWDRTTEPEGFPSLPPDLRDSIAWQFQISSNEHGRIHGLMIGDVFHVVWVDPQHLLYGG